MDLLALDELLRHLDLLWLALLACSGVVAYLTLGSWWALAAFFVYGTIYSSCDPRSHDLDLDLDLAATFKTCWLNSFFCNLTLFMPLKEQVMWRWRHARNHTDTVHVGRDPEIQVTRPADLPRIGSDLFFLRNAKEALTPTIRHAFGDISPDARHYVPESEWHKMIWSARQLVGSIGAADRALRRDRQRRAAALRPGPAVLCELAQLLRLPVAARRPRRGL